jgi:hypothetical protein
MQGQTPITDAVYGKRSTPRKPPRTAPRRQAERLVGRMIGEEAVADLYRGLKFKRPDQRPNRGQRRG